MRSIKKYRRLIVGLSSALLLIVALEGCGGPKPPDVGIPTPFPDSGQMRPTTDPNEAFRN